MSEMVDVVINGGDVIKGKMTVTRSLQETEEGSAIVVSGVLLSESYVEVIELIETDRLYVHGVEVYEESFGTNSKEIAYSFYAKELIIQ